MRWSERNGLNNADAAADCELVKASALVYGEIMEA
jgi:hypothetical protein